MMDEPGRSERDEWYEEVTKLMRLLRRRCAAISARLRNAHVPDGGSDEGSVLHGAFNAEHFPDLDVGKRDGIATFAKGRILVGDEGVRCVVGTALKGDFYVADGGYLPH